MKKCVLLILICFTIQAQSQPWSKIVTSNDFPKQNTFPGAYNSLLQIYPDAIDLNLDNSQSVYPEGAMYSVYSPPVFIDDLSWHDPTISQTLGSWLLAFDANGNEVLNQKMELPSSFDFGNLGAAYEFISISSISYDQRDLIVFTGTMWANSNTSSPAVQYQTMIIGTYNLRNDQVKLKYLDHNLIPQLNVLPNGSEVWDRILQYSKGVSVDRLDENEYVALGNIMHPNYQPVHFTGNPKIYEMDYPVQVPFSVDNNGIITIQNIEIYDFKYKILEATKFAGNNAVVAVGVVKEDHSHNYSCNGNAHSDNLGLGVVSFKTNGSIGDHGIYFLEEFQQNREWNSLTPMSISYNQLTQKTYIAYSEHNNSGDGIKSVVGKFDVGITAPFFNRLVTDNGVTNSAQRLVDKSFLSGNVELLMRLEDPSDHFGHSSYNSIGVIEVDPNTLSPVLPDVTSIFTEESGGNSPTRKIKNVTGINNSNTRFDYVLADGVRQGTTKSRAHIYGISGDIYECFDYVGLHENPVCFDSKEIEDYKVLSQNNISGVNPIVSVPDYQSTSCLDVSYPSQPGEELVPGFGKTTGTKSIDDDESRIVVYPSPASNELTIEFGALEERSDLRVMNVKGEIMDEFAVAETGRFTIDVSNYSSGIYFILFSSKSETRQLKFIKE